jgi:hypothetical protein
MLTHLRERYGGARGYFHTTGLIEAELDQLQQRLR